MANVRVGRGQGVLPGPGQSRKSLSVLVMMLVAVLAAIVLMSHYSQRASHTSGALLGSAVAAPPGAASTPPPPGAAPEQASAAPPAPAEDEGEVTSPSQRRVARVIDDGRDGIKACYQRSLVRNETLVHGRMNVRLSIAPSGRVDTVKVTGPAEFHSVQACLERATTRWTFPAASEPYAAEFPLVFQGAL